MNPVPAWLMRRSKGAAAPLRLARVLLSTQYATMLEYRAEIALWALSGVIPFLMFGLWSQLPGAAPSLAGPLLARYFVAVFVVRQFTLAWVAWAFEDDHLQGRLAPYLLQPLHPLWRYLCAHLAEQATRLPFILLIAGVFLALQPQAIGAPNPAQWLGGLVAVELAFALNFLLQSLVAILCFWTERATALDRLLYTPFFFLSGLVAPLDTFPDWLHRLALCTPFPLVIDFPARLLAGAPVGVISGFALQLLWIGLLLPLVIGCWRLGVRRYGAMGA
jgi:ABC-2 type transport system permease protein